MILQFMLLSSLGSLSRKYCNIVLNVDLELVYHLNNILLTFLFVCVIADKEFTDKYQTHFPFFRGFFIWRKLCFVSVALVYY